MNDLPQKYEWKKWMAFVQNALFIFLLTSNVLLFHQWCPSAALSGPSLGGTQPDETGLWEPLGGKLMDKGKHQLRWKNKYESIDVFFSLFQDFVHQ